MPPARSRFTPADHVVHDACPVPVDGNHAYIRAHQRGCRCPGPSLDAYRAQKAAELDRRRERDRLGSIPVGVTDKHEQRYRSMPGPTHEASRLERDLHAREDLACRGENAELFFPISSLTQDGRFQESAAKAVCRRCPAADDCLTVGLAIGDDFAVMGGTTARERREIRKTMNGWAA